MRCQAHCDLFPRTVLVHIFSAKNLRDTFFDVCRCNAFHPDFRMNLNRIFGQCVFDVRLKCVGIKEQ